MLVAKRDLNCFGKLVQCGEPIPTPEKWDAVALQSNLNLGWVGESDKCEDDLVKGTEEVQTETAPSNTNPNACPVCQKLFKSPRAVKVHQRSHDE